MRRLALTSSSLLVAIFGLAHCSVDVTGDAPGAASGGGGQATGGQEGDPPGLSILGQGGEGGTSRGIQGQGGSVDTTGCGDGLIQPGERCDDSNSTSGDGCAGDCQSVEQNFACPVPGQLCVSTVLCGDGKVRGLETCDDGNTAAGDGCSKGCALEAGWQCPAAGSRCVAAACGDGIIAGNEECEDDDSTPTSGDGCSNKCVRETGFACGAAGVACHVTVCGDGIKEGDEPCDDMNQVVGDGCNPFCEVEPNCSMGACVSACGDGMLLPGDNEACDDGNATSGDGCSATCTIESGFSCQMAQGALPSTLEVPVTFRDFVAFPTNGAARHPDFQIFSGSAATPGMVEANLGNDGKPVYTGICDAGLSGPCPYGQQTTTEANFDQWYNDTAGVNLTEVTRLSLNQQAAGTYYFPDSSFFPFDGLGWTAAAQESTWGGHNFAFTSEIRYWFEFKGDEALSFSGDDDVWVFVNGKLALDLGGLHPSRSGSFTLDTAMATTLGLSQGNVYEIALFHAERHTGGSNFNLTLAGFVSGLSSCDTFCGDGIVAGNEVCDDGVNDGSYGSCLPGCLGRGPFCGDGVKESGVEACDDGTNLTTYSTSGQAECAPGCVLGAFCGDDQVDSLFGEQCDDGTNAGGYGGCGSDCLFGPRCGDGEVQGVEGEQCDDGNTVSGDGCSSACKSEGPR